MAEAIESAITEMRGALGPGAALTGEAAAEFVDPHEPLSWGSA